MFYYEKSITGKSNCKKIWDLYSNVNKWCVWDKSLKSVHLQGDFCSGASGIMEMADNSKLPFLLTEVTYEKSFTTQSNLGDITVSFDHLLSENNDDTITITHTIKIEGKDECQIENIGKNLSLGVQNCLENLISL